MSSMIGYITRVMSAFKHTGAFGEEELREIESILYAVAQQETRDVVLHKADRNTIASSFSAIALVGHQFKVKEGEKVIVYELICTVTARDFTNGKIQVMNPFWGIQWVPEQSCIRIQELFTLGMLRDVIKTAMSPNFIKDFKKRIGREKSIDLDHDTEASGYLEYEKNESKELSKIDK